MPELREVRSFGVLSHYSSGCYELFIEDFEGDQFRFDFGFNELAQLAKLAAA